MRTRQFLGLLMLGLCWIAASRPGISAAPEPSVTLSVTPNATVPVTAPITLSATVIGVTSPLCEFWVQPKNGVWQRISEKGSAATCCWSPSAGGSYSFMVTVSSGAASGLQCLAMTGALTVITATPINVALATMPSEPVQYLPMKLTAKATSAGALEYAFAVKTATGPVKLLQAFSAAKECTWHPTDAGALTFLLFIRTPNQPAGLLTSVTKTVAVEAGTFGGVSITQYRGDRDAAISYTFDDGMICQTDVIAPLFTKYGMPATFCINTGWVLELNDFTDPARPADWTGWRRVLAAGHEVGNHSLTHQNLPTLSDAALAEEVNSSAGLLQSHLGITPLTFAYPFNSWDERTKAVVLQHHIWARDRYISLDAATFTLATANAMIDTAIAQRSWIVPNGHGVDGAGYGAISSSVLENHLAYVKSRKSTIWVDTAANVARYVQERDTAQIQLLTSTATSRSFVVKCPGLNPGIYTVPLTVKINTGSITATTVTVTQGITRLPVYAIKPGVIYIEVIPSDVPIVVNFT
jgi:peptidoglycan/xylan/chitin deacetylase (PgdA/CDA1 family)